MCWVGGDTILSDRQEYAQRIHQVVAALSQRVTATEIADTMVHEVAAALGARAASVFLFDDARDRTVVLRTVGYPEELLARWGSWSMNGSPLISAVRAGQALFASSRATDSRFDP
jgi:hypothetical protein